tara:strand:+ start:440 stop:724 length:285 start_codon:yes stop_codon:yes gene_type:complete
MEALVRGADVFRNSVKTGDTDIVLRINGEYIPIDVKAKKWNPRQGIWRSAGGEKIPEHVYGVGVNPETKEVSWYKFHGSNYKFVCPKGLEDFWK